MRQLSSHNYKIAFRHLLTHFWLFITQLTAFIFTEQYEPKASLTHTSPADKNDLVFYWEPTSDQKSGEVTFHATLAKAKNIYWVNQKSNPVNLQTPVTTAKTVDPTDTVSLIFKFLILTAKHLPPPFPI